MNENNQPAVVNTSNVVPNVDPVVLQTDGGPISLEFETHPAQQQAPAPAQSSAPAPIVPAQPTNPVAPAAAPIAAPATAANPQATSQYLEMLQHQAQQGQVAMQQLQQMQAQIPALQTALAAAQHGTQQQVQSANVALDSQITEMFGENAPAVKKIMTALVENEVQKRVDPIQQQHQEIVMQRYEQEKDEQARTAAMELMDIGLPQNDVLMFVDTIRQNANAKQLNPTQFSSVVRAMAMKHLVTPYMRSQQQAAATASSAQAPPQSAATPAPMGLSPTVPSVHPQIAAAEAAKQQGQLIVGSGTQPQAQQPLTQSAIDELLLKQAWAM